MANKVPPLLSIGSFGTHVLALPSGRFGFVGTVPTDLDGRSYATEALAIEALALWLRFNVHYLCLASPVLREAFDRLLVV